MVPPGLEHIMNIAAENLGDVPSLIQDRINAVLRWELGPACNAARAESRAS
jgi:hypothetical protein